MPVEYQEAGGMVAFVTILDLRVDPEENNNV